MISPNGKAVRPLGDVLRVLDGKTGAIVRTEGALTSGPIVSSTSAVAIGGRAPLVLGWPSLAARRVAAPDYMVNTVAVSPQRGSFFFGGDSGGSTIASPAG